jgi:hypothetical protein
MLRWVPSYPLLFSSMSKSAWGHPSHPYRNVCKYTHIRCATYQISGRHEELDQLIHREPGNFQPDLATFIVNHFQRQIKSELETSRT